VAKPVGRQDRPQTLDARRHLAPWRRGPLHLDRVEDAVLLDEEVDFVAGGGPEQGQPGRPTDAREGAQELSNDRILEHRPAESAGESAARVSQPEEVAERSRVTEVELRRLHEPLREVRVVRAEPHHLVARFEDAHPGLHGVHGDPERAGDVAQVQKLARPRGEREQQTPEITEVADLAKGADVALERGPL